MSANGSQERDILGAQNDSKRAALKGTTFRQRQRKRERAALREERPSSGGAGIGWSSGGNRNLIRQLANCK